MFINDIIRSLSETKFVIYAGDTSALISDNNLWCFAERAGNLPSDLKTWLTVIRLTLIDSKTKLIVFYQKRCHHPTFSFITLTIIL